MKVQFSPGRMRIRIGRAEFDTLRSAGRLSLAFPVSPGPWRVEVTAGPVWTLTQVGSCVVVEVPADALDALAARLPSRDGIAGRLDLLGDPVDVALEVDIRDGRPPRTR